MKRYLKYGLLIITVFAVIGLVFYVVKKPKESVLKNIAADVTYCLTIDKQILYKETKFWDRLKKDSFYQKLNSQIPLKAKEILEATGINPLGDIALFGETNTELNLAWIGNNESALNTIIKKYKWQEKKFPRFNQIKISDKLYLNYKWPILVLSSIRVTENFDFFNPAIRKLSDIELKHTKTKGSIIYGFIIPDRNTIITYPFIPLYGRAFIGIKTLDKKIELTYIQRRVKLNGKLGLPTNKPLSYALLSWPIDSEPVALFKKIPTPVMNNFNQMVSKPVSHLYAEVLDTISTYQEIVQYKLDAEFRLTQKIIDYYKTYPGLRLELTKKIPDNANQTKPTNMGLDIFKLQLTETSNSYCISSENKLIPASAQHMPDYYIYANLDLLKTDPFWEPYIKTNFKTLQFHAEPLGKGSVFVLSLE